MSVAQCWDSLAQTLQNEITKIQKGSSDAKSQDLTLSPSTKYDSCRFTLFPLTDDFHLVTCKYCQVPVNIPNFARHNDICPANPSNKNKYPATVPIKRDLMVPRAQPKNGKKNQKEKTQEKPKQIRKRMGKRSRTPRVSVSQLLSDIVGRLPVFEEDTEEDRKILFAAHHISNFAPEPLAVPRYVRKNIIRRSIRHLPTKTGPNRMEESPLPLMAGDAFVYNNFDSRINITSNITPLCTNQTPAQAQAARELLLKKRLEAGSPRKLYFSISPSKARGSAALSPCTPEASRLKNHASSAKAVVND